MRGLLIIFLVALVTSCGAASSSESSGESNVDSAASVTTNTTAPQADDTVRVSPSVLADIDASLPENVGALDLGEVAPADDTSFCQAFASAPARWLDDAVVPIQYWVDNFAAARPTAPSAAAEPLDRLLAHGDDMLAWNFGRLDERPVWGGSQAADVVAVADIAVAECPGLPLVVGPPGQSAAPSYWAESTPDQVARSCEEDAAEVAEGTQWYVDEFGVLPEHQQQIETAASQAIYAALEKTGEFPDDVDFYFASRYHGVGPDGEPAAVSGGACDL